MLGFLSFISCFFFLLFSWFSRPGVQAFHDLLFFNMHTLNPLETICTLSFLHFALSLCATKVFHVLVFTFEDHFL